MTHLTPDQLERWWDRGAAADRERIVAHLARCDACAAAYGRLIDQRPVETPAAANRKLVASGYAAYRSKGGAARGWRIRWRSPAVLALGAAALLLAVLVPLLRRPPLVAPADDSIRAGSIQPLAPAGRVSEPPVFRWASPVVAAAYELEVLNQAEEILWSGRSDTTELQAPPELLEALEPGQPYRWRAIAIDRRGRSTIRSPLQFFVYAPRGP